MSFLKIRRARPDDVAFVIDTWVESFRNTYAAGVVPMEHYQADYRKYVSWILEKRRPTVLVAYDAEAEVPGAELLGFLAFEEKATYPTGNTTRTVGPVVHYVYVKEYARERGLARALFAAGRIDQHGAFVFTFKPTDLDKSRVPRARWNPLIARHPLMHPKTPTPTEQTTNEAQDGEVSRPRGRAG